MDKFENLQTNNEKQHYIPMEVTAETIKNFGINPADVVWTRIGNRKARVIMIPVSEEQYYEYMRPLWREDKRQQRQESVVSLDKLYEETEYEAADTDSDLEAEIMKKMLIDELHKALDELEEIDRTIMEMYSNNHTQTVSRYVPEELDQEVEKIKQKYEPLLKDPVNTIGEIGQSICDTADEKGVAYSFGYIVTEVVTALLADKGLDKLKNVAKTGKTADNVADIAEGAAKGAGNAAEDAGKAGKELEGVAKGAESAVEDAGKVVEGGSSSTINGLKIIDGKVDGKIPTPLYEKYRVDSVHNPDSDTMTLGKYEPTILADDTKDFSVPGPGAYTVKAGDTTYFSLGTEWDLITETYNLDKAGKNMFDYFNKPALDDAVKNNKIIRFSHNPESYGDCALKWEWDYLQEQHGYFALEKEGDFWYAIR